jgi:ABC-type multidrug transport system fused ATPase/permease subunit
MVPLLALYAFAGYRLLPALQQIFAAFALLRRSVAALDVLHEDLSSSSDQGADKGFTAAGDQAVDPLPFRDALELRDVTFFYQGTTEPAINGVNIIITPNSSVGFVGPSGCGKSTTVDIILGLLRPVSGVLVSDSVEIADRNLARWQQNLGYVPQHIFISDDTVARNIAFGIPDERIDLDAVKRAAGIAQLDHFIEHELPSGYNTEIGERGMRLSGGQRQRIGIARALYHDPPVLIFDEATSALDGITEDEVMEAVRSLSRKKTLIMIAHRLSTVKECDTIYVLEHGRVSTFGRYDDLMRDCSWFRAASGDSDERA